MTPQRTPLWPNPLDLGELRVGDLRVYYHLIPQRKAGSIRPFA